MATMQNFSPGAIPAPWRRRAMALSGALLVLACGAATVPGLVAEEIPADEPRFVFETGDPPWRGERLVLPPNFAPDLGWSGVEHIRFSPGMFEAGTPDFFSYLIVFLLEPGADCTREGLERETLVYYRGLSEAVMGSRGFEVDSSGFEAGIEAAEGGPEAAGVPESAGEASSWRGTLDWVEPFATRQSQRLHFEMHTWEHEGRPVVLSCVSPLDPADEDATGVWDTLREISARFRLEEPER